MIRFAVIGTGWRSEFYARIAKALPTEFELVSWLCRNEAKMNGLREKYALPTTMSEEDVLATNPDFVVSAVDKVSMSEVVQYWSSKNVAVLSETPAALDIENLRAIKKAVDNGAKIQVAEQYFLQPLLRAAIDETDNGTIGEPVSITLSAMHDYHAASVIRRTLKTGLSDVTIYGKSYMTKVTGTKTRYETLTDGIISEKEDRHLCMEYQDGKVAFYDFMSEQYRSTIRHKYINIRGTRGEIINDTVYYLDQNNIGQKKKLTPINPYAQGTLGEDEIAIAEFMKHMKAYIDTGKEAYPISEALYDAYIAIKMEEASKSNFKPVQARWKDI